MSTTEITVASLPAADTPPAGGATKSAVRRDILGRSISRRSLFRGAAGLGVFLGIGTLELFPWAKPASAAVPTTWNYCSQWKNSATEDWLNCNPNGLVNGNAGTLYCGAGSKYHRVDSEYAGGATATYYRRPNSCTAENQGGTWGNAWRWLTAEGPNTGPADVFCSDGRFVVTSGGTEIARGFSVCRRRNAVDYDFYNPRAGL